MRYKRTYQYDAVFALGFVTVYEQLMEGYSDSEDRDAIFNTYIQALKEDPDQYSNKVNQIRPLRRKTYKLPGPDWIALANTRSLTAISVEVNAAFL
ncbi:hypothetical protein B296_00045684 [Ensete ventricosum]|uniref:Uncharacterized protein n=1 Tax=Ensete ventricosum TaxID=4639 RepID=A0A426Z6M5_ENSVE|nr:hypothetical protein B296_00045684 [Ensete ventricosum]